MPNRQCGKCSACCEGWVTSDVVKMSPGHPCQHRTEGGCGIYSTRPHIPCRVFICGWLQQDSPLPEEMRPDLAGVIVLFDRKWEGWRVIEAIPTGPTIPEASQQWLMEHAKKVRMPLLLHEHVRKGGRYVRQQTKGFGPPAFIETVRVTVRPDDVVQMY